MIAAFGIAGLIVAGFLVVHAVALVIYGARTLVCHWRHCQAVIRLTAAESDKAVPCWPAGESEILVTHAELIAGLCWRCNDGTGRCMCSSRCGAQACAGGLSGEDFTDWDAEWLNALGITEGTGQ